MKLNRWSWGYLPVALVLGLIWFEFWRSGAFKPADQPAPAPESNETVSGVTPGTPEGAGGGGTRVPVAVTVGEVPLVPVVPVAGANAKVEINEAFLKNPPPITVSFSGEPLQGAVDAIREALHTPTANMTVQNSGGNANQMFTVDMKNKPFWEVMRALQEQGRFGFYPSGTGLVLSTSYSPVYQFETSGPVALIPMSVNYSRSVNPQAPESRGQGYYNLQFGIAVDPRITISRRYQLSVTEALDEAGRSLPLNSGFNGSSTGSMVNYWSSSISIPEPANRPKSLKLKCEVRFAAMLEKETATIEDASQKSGEVFTLGDRKLKLARSEVTGSTYMLQVTGEDGSPVSNLTMTLTDSQGRSTTSTVAGGSTRSYSTQTYQPPYKLSFVDNNGGIELTFPFELKDIPMP